MVITDPDDPTVNPASPFNDVPHPYVAGTGKVLSATGPAYTPAGLDLTALVHVDQATGVVTYNPASFAFLKAGDKVVVTIGFNANSGPDTVAEQLTVTINGVNDAPEFATGATVTQLSVPANGVPFGRGEIFAFGPALSADGRFTVFGASNEIPGQNDDNSKLGDVYLYDRLTGTYKWISDPANFTNSGITLHPGETYNGLGTISRDGQTVAFKGEFQTTQTIGGQPVIFNQSEVFLYNTGTGVITRVPGLTGDQPSINGNGSLIASTGQSLTAPSGNDFLYNDVLVTDRFGHVLTRISGDTNASPVNTADISADGRYVTFWTTASQIEVKNIKPTGGPIDNLTFNVGATYPADPSAPSGSIAQIYVFDRQTETINLVSVSPAGEMGNGNSSVRSIQTTNGFIDIGDDWKSAISVDDRFIIFQSNASNLVSGDTNGATDVFLYDLQTHQVQLVSVAADGSAANGSSYRPAISPDGNFIVFASDATNLLGASAICPVRRQWIPDLRPRDRSGDRPGFHRVRRIPQRRQPIWRFHQPGWRTYRLRRGGARFQREPGAGGADFGGCRHGQVLRRVDIRLQPGRRYADSDGERRARNADARRSGQRPDHRRRVRRQPRNAAVHRVDRRHQPCFAERRHLCADDRRR